ncbi:dITPase [Methanococcoides vulcani]|uniref:dITP/XTP pyrophosphatase n=1 Tax=Methanococcoides vulcani TaxID=1353158 RepID=A0A1H9YEY8_9EURY|nr:XTP/dITP diphosphatase [Methanococcoides vulcani]SES67530.1 dITPase [Methanococcoides vulcani]
MRKMVFVTGNKGKFGEAKEILAAKEIELIQNTDGYPELQEDDLEPIAAYGAKWAAEKLKHPVMVDDSGLFINTLNGFPGPYSAFVEDNLGNQKVLKLMEGEKDRSAVFKSVIGYCEPGGESSVFTGTVEGKIAFEERGTGGFGYDPIFEYEGKTFGELGTEVKNTISHRRRALDKFFEWLD